MYEKFLEIIEIYGVNRLIQKIEGVVSGLLKSTLFKGFEGKTSIIVSSLYVPPTKIDDKLIPLVVKFNDKNNPIPVFAPQPVTGVRDAIGLSLLSVTLKESGIEDFKIIHDPVHPSDKSDNLILIGGPTSNLVGKELYDRLPKRYFSFNQNFDKIILNGVTYGTAQEGMYGIILRCKNCWNSKRDILWFAGIGPTGTEASIRAIVEDFKCIPDKNIRNRLLKEREWIVVIKGKVSNGYVTDVEYLDSSFEL